MAGVPWDASYLDGPAPWDVGRPQPAIARLGELAGPVLDVGCGTGENALHIAATGVPVLGIDVAETAVSIARRKAADRGVDAGFETADALQLDLLAREFETVLDCGLFHTFDGAERHAYTAGLASVTARGGHLYLLCFSDAGPGRLGPHPVSEAALREAFEAGTWRVDSLVPERIETRFDAQGVPAWMARIERL